MSAPAILVVLIAANELSSPATAAMLHAARETLGAGTTLRLETLRSTAEESQLPQPQVDQAYVSVSWQGQGHESARILGRLLGTDRDTERVLSFGPADPEEERGRSVGFVIASLFAGIEAANVSIATRRPEVARARAPASLPRHAENRYAFSLAAVGAYPKSASSFGAYLDAARGFGQTFHAGLYVDARFGSIPAAQASTRWLSIGAVGRLTLVAISSRIRLVSVLRAGIRQLSVTHLSEDDTVADQQGAYLPLGSFALRLAADVAESAAIYADAGVEVQAGEVMVNVRGGTVATIPMVLGTGSVGVMARF